MSIESQKAVVLRDFGERFDIEFIEEERSAFLPENRPAFDDMLARLIAGEKKGLIAWHPDRLSRNEVDAARITYALRKGQIGDLKFCSYTFENSPEGIMHLQSALSHSQYESAKKAIDVNREMLQKAGRGWFPDRAPNGYRNVKPRHSREPVIDVDEERFELLRKAVDLVLSRTATPAQARRILNNEWGFRSHMTGEPIGIGGWYKLLGSRFYCGYFTWQGKEYKGNHRPMISIEEHYELLRILGRTARVRPQKHEFAFSNTMKCKSCTYSVVFEKHSKFVKIAGGVKTYTVARCSRKNPAMVCPDRVNLNEDNLIEQIAKKLTPYTIHPVLLEAARKTIEEIRVQEQGEDVLVRQTAEKALKRAKDGKQSLVRMRSLDQIDDAEFEQAKRTFDEEIASLESRLLEGDKARESKWFELTADTFEFLTQALGKLGSGTPNERRQVLLGLCEQPQLDFGTLIAEPNKWLVPIGRANTIFQRDFERFEPSLLGSGIKKDEAFESLRLLWWDVVKEVRDVFREINRTDIRIPKFDP